MLKAIDFTSGGDEDEVEVMVSGDKKFKVKKKYIAGVQELKEYGVYNSETDIGANPKSGENKPDELTGFIAKLTDSVQGLIGDITELKNLVDENSSISFDSLDVCIGELQSYLKSLEQEAEVSGSASPS